jgi:hypothetical protein
MEITFVKIYGEDSSTLHLVFPCNKENVAVKAQNVLMTMRFGSFMK